MITISTVDVESADPVELFSAAEATNFTFAWYADGQPSGSAMISASSDGSGATPFAFAPMADVVGTGYLILPAEWLPVTVQVVAWNTD